MAVPFAVVEPNEEVGYKMRPPLLEDVSVEGPLRIPIPHALDTIEQRDAIEEDYNWWRYSKLAAGWLIFMLLLVATIFTATAFEQAGNLKEIRNGVPRYYQLSADSQKNMEGGLLKNGIRNIRIAAVWLCTLPAVFVFIVLFSKPRPGLRKALMIILAIIMFCGAVLAIIAFGIAEDDSRLRAYRCHELGWKQLNTVHGIVRFIIPGLTNEYCENYFGIAQATLALDFMMFIVTLTAVIVLILTTITGDFKLLRTGWREQERDLESERPRLNKYNIKPYRVRETRLLLTSLAVLLVILIGITYAVFIIVVHLNHDQLFLRSYRGRTSPFFDRPPEHPIEEEGWSARNTRLRYAWSAIAILTILANFIPWRSRIIAWVFAFIYFATGAMAFVSFGLDVYEIRKTRKRGCPTVPYNNLDSAWQANRISFINLRLNCINSPYVAVCIIEFIYGIAVVIYLLNEYFIRCSSVHSQRKYPWFMIRKQETKLDSRRPIRCELTSQVMTAKEYYYKHRFLAGGSTISGPSELSLLAPPVAAPILY